MGLRCTVPVLLLFLGLTGSAQGQVLGAGGSGFRTERTAEGPAKIDLPDAPGAVVAGEAEGPRGDPSGAGPPAGKPCASAMYHLSNPEAESAEVARAPCKGRESPYQRFLDTTAAVALTPKQKGYLAMRNLVDPFNLLTIVANSGFTIGIDSHTAYGPGLRGFGRDVGDSLLQDATGEFIGTFAVCSLVHEDPHYHRRPDATPVRRVFHAIGRTVISQHDDGSLMPNYENFITYPATAEIANLYVPGVAGNGPSTVKRVAIGLATDPINNLITEFLPDFAKRVHVRIVFVQHILDQVSTGQPMQF
jgi:hypothetical protein